MSRGLQLRLAFTVLTLIAMLAGSPSAEAGCEYGYTITTTYFAFVDNMDPSIQWCKSQVIGPCFTCMATWQPIGGTRFSECDGSWDTWGDTTSCTDPENTEQTFARCGLVCS